MKLYGRRVNASFYTKDKVVKKKKKPVFAFKEI
jgi:hypothetical protein